MSNMVCKVCGSTYSYCPGCVKDMNKPRWMTSFDKEVCKEVFDALVANSSKRMSDADALSIVERSGVRVTSKSIQNHINRLKSNRSSNVNQVEENKVEPMPVPVEHSEEKKALFNAEKKDGHKDNGVEKNDKNFGSLFSKSNNYSSNSKNKEKVKQDAGSIASAISQLDEQKGFSGL